MPRTIRFLRTCPSFQVFWPVAWSRSVPVVHADEVFCSSQDSTSGV